VAPPTISAKFHNALVNALVDVCGRIAEERALRTVVISGGVFQNEYLVSRAIPALRRRGLVLYEHHLIPPNDGGVALGQAAIARALCAR
jgi:hydrogenase maturation protein HypF